jgi:hypothetical protein
LVGSNISPRMKTAGKTFGAEPSSSSQQMGEVEIVGSTCDDMVGILEKDGETLKWG